MHLAADSCTSTLRSLSMRATTYDSIGVPSGLLPPLQWLLSPLPSSLPSPPMSLYPLVTMRQATSVLLMVRNARHWRAGSWTLGLGEERSGSRAGIRPCRHRTSWCSRF